MAYPTVYSMGVDNVDKILATTLSNYSKEMSDNIFTGIPAFHYLYRKNKKTYQGGLTIVIPLQYKKNSTVASYSRFDTIDITPQDNITNCQYRWKQYAAGVSLSGFDLRVNTGKEQLINLIKAEVKNTEMSMQDAIATDLFASSPATNDIHSLPILVDATSTIGEINSTSNSWWQSTNTTSGSFAGQGLTDMRTLYNTLSQYNQKDKPDFIITTQTVFEYYENLVQIQQRFTSTDSADASFETLKFKNMTMFWDESCNSGVLYMLNSNHLQLVVHSAADFALSDYVRPANQDAKSAIMVWQGNLVTDSRRHNGKLNTITA